MKSADVDDSMWSEPVAKVTPEDVTEATWDLLRESALAALEHAYVPYSSYPVGAAALSDDGRIVSGCNVENASFGITLCAECSLISDLHMTGGGRLVAFDCVDGWGATLAPCGRCRQLLFEHGGGELVLNMPSGRMTMDLVLPDAFGPGHLSAGHGLTADRLGGADPLSEDTLRTDGPGQAAPGTPDHLGEEPTRRSRPKH